MQDLWAICIDGIKANVEQRLEEAGVPNLQFMDECFDIDAINPFNGLETEYRQRKYYKEQFGLLVSFSQA